MLLFYQCVESFWEGLRIFQLPLLNIPVISRYHKFSLITCDSEIPALWSLVQKGPVTSFSVSSRCFLWLRFMTLQMVYSSC